MQGWRLTMEDAHSTILDLEKSSSSDASSKEKMSFFSVYDGHGGSTVARFAGDTVHSRLQGIEDYKNKKYEAALKRAFISTDEDLRSNPDFQNDPSGCTAVVTLITPQGSIYCANAGDSRSVLSVKGEAKPMSYDHKPVNKEENARIVAAGGFVEFGRVNGNLALSRALGDFEFKQNGTLSAEKQVVTADPDIICHEKTDEDEFLILACDGIWDVMTSQNAVDFIRRKIAEKRPLDKICEDLIDHCLAPDSDWGGVGCDNMTLMVIALLNGRTLDEWYEWVAERVEKKVGFNTPTWDDLPNPFKSRGNATGTTLGNLSGSAGNVPGSQEPHGGWGSGDSSNSQEEDNGYGDKKPVHLQDDSDDDEATVSSIVSALRREGIEVQPRSNSMDVDSKRNDEVPADVVKQDGLLDKVSPRAIL